MKRASVTMDCMIADETKFFFQRCIRRPYFFVGSFGFCQYHLDHIKTSQASSWSKYVKLDAYCYNCRRFTKCKWERSTVPMFIKCLDCGNDQSKITVKKLEERLPQMIRPSKNKEHVGT